MTNKERLHELIDQLPEAEVEAARRYLEYLRDAGDPVLSALLEAPEDDESEGEEERAALQDAYEDLRAGRIVSHKKLKRDLGL